MNEQTVQLLIQVGETTLPLVEADISKVLGFAKENGGNADTIAQLEANAVTIAQDEAQVKQEMQDAITAEPESDANAAEPVAEPADTGQKPS